MQEIVRQWISGRSLPILGILANELRRQTRVRALPPCGRSAVSVRSTCRSVQTRKSNAKGAAAITGVFCFSIARDMIRCDSPKSMEPSPALTRDKKKPWHGGCRREALVLFAVIELLLLPGLNVHAQSPAPQSAAAPAMVELEAKQQRREGDRLIADGNVDVRYQTTRLRADHIEYNDKTYDTRARGNVQFDFENQHLEGSEASYNVKSGHGTYLHVRGTVKTIRDPNPRVLLSSNPLYFEAEEVDRLDAGTYEFRSVWLTICLPNEPVWKFYATHATLKLNQSVALVSANFRLFRIPVFYLPYASVPAGRRVRQSGFLVPEIANTSSKGFIIGDSYYWAPRDWVDLEVGAQLLSRRGSSQNVEFRARPWEDARLDYHYYGVVDRGLPGPNGTPVQQGGHESR